MSALKALSELEYQERYKNSSIPQYARFKKKFGEKGANQLTHAIITFLNLSGHQAERISTTGRMIDKRKVVRNCVGQVQQIGSATWIPSSGQKGSADVSAIIKNKDGIGVSVKIEIKMKDRQSEAQRQYQRQVERAGGQYWLVRSFDEFMNKYNFLLKS